MGHLHVRYIRMRHVQGRDLIFRHRQGVWISCHVEDGDIILSHVENSLITFGWVLGVVFILSVSHVLVRGLTSDQRDEVVVLPTMSSVPRCTYWSTLCMRGSQYSSLVVR